MAKPREGVEIIFLEAPPGLKDRLKAVARANRRSMTAEAILALERYVESQEAALAQTPKGRGKGKAKS
jgi:predicted transcriptional regulator